MKERAPHILLELNALVSKFNKYSPDIATVEDPNVKQLARNFKAIATRAE